MFSFLNKKIILIIIFVIIVIGLGYGIYALFFKQTPPESPVIDQPIDTGISGGLPSADIGPGQIIDLTASEPLPTDADRPEISQIARGGLTETTELNQSPSSGASLSRDGSNLQYYNQEDGKFYKIDSSGVITPLSDKIFNNVETIAWSPNKNKAILEYPDGANILYNFSDDKQITLPAHWKEFDFSPSGGKIVMKSIGLDPSNRWLAIANEDGSNTVPLEPIGLKDETIYPSWSPNNQVVAMYTEGVDFDRQEVFFLGLNNENFKSTVVEGRGFQPQWSPKGDKLLYSVYSSKNYLKPMLWAVNAQGDNIGQNRKSLNINTWADKCVFGNNIEIYCAVPTSIEEGAGLFPELAANTVDQLYKIDLNTGLKKLIATPNEDYNMSNLILADNDTYLYFTDTATQRIYKIQLK